MTEIKVKKISENESLEFEVEVVGEGSRSRHRVSMGKDFYKNLETKVSPEEVIKKSFEFLLEREPKESILREFDVSIISQYFPEYKEKIKKQLT